MAIASNSHSRAIIFRKAPDIVTGDFDNRDAFFRPLDYVVMFKFAGLSMPCAPNAPSTSTMLNRNAPAGKTVHSRHHTDQ